MFRLAQLTVGSSMRVPADPSGAPNEYSRTREETAEPSNDECSMSTAEQRRARAFQMVTSSASLDSDLCEGEFSLRRNPFLDPIRQQ